MAIGTYLGSYHHEDLGSSVHLCERKTERTIERERDEERVPEREHGRESKGDRESVCVIERMFKR